MNLIQKSLAITYFLVFIFTTGLSIDSVCAQDRSADQVASRRLADVISSPYLKFDRLTIEDGRSSNKIWAVVQDHQGFMWFGTADGLNRYDGADFKIYRRDPGDPNSLSQSFIRYLFIDRSGEIWIGTWGGGLNRYDLEKDRFIRLPKRSRRSR